MGSNRYAAILNLNDIVIEVIEIPVDSEAPQGNAMQRWVRSDTAYIGQKLVDGEFIDASDEFKAMFLSGEPPKPKERTLEELTIENHRLLTYLAYSGYTEPQ